MPQHHPRPIESEPPGVSPTVEQGLDTHYHLKQQDNILGFSEVNTSRVQSVTRVVVWVEAVQASVHSEPWDQNVNDSAKRIHVITRCLNR